MHRRIIQLGDIILPASTDLIEDEKESSFSQEYAFADGAKVFNTRARISSKTGLLKGVFYDPHTLPSDMDIITKKDGVPISKVEFVNYIHKFSQQATYILGVGIDERIYRLKVRIGLPSWKELTLNSFSWELPVLGYETFWEDVTDRLFYTYLDRSIVDGKPFWKYNNEVKFYDYTTSRFSLVVLDLPASFNYHEVSKTVLWDGVVDTSSLFVNGENTTYTLDGFMVNNTNVISDDDSFSYTVLGESIVFSSQSTLSSVYISLETAIDANEFTSVDTIDTSIAIDGELEVLKLYLHTNNSEYISVDLLDKYVGQEIIQVSKGEFINTNFSGQINYIRLEYKHATMPVTITLGKALLTKRFGAGMDQIVDNFAYIPSVAGKCEVKVAVYFDSRSTKRRLTINDKVINVINENIVIVTENQILIGTSIYNLRVFDKFVTRIEENISIQVDSDRPAISYYSVANLYL